MNNRLISLAAALALGSQLQALAAGPTTTTTTSTKLGDTRIDSGSSRRSIDVNTARPINHHIRTQSEALKHRSAQQKNKFDHTINKTTMIMRSPLSTVHIGRMPKIDAGGKSSDKQHFVITAGHDDEKGDGSEREKTGAGQTLASKAGGPGIEREDGKSGSHRDGKIAQKEKANAEERRAERENRRDERRHKRESRREERRVSFLGHFRKTKNNNNKDGGDSGAPGSGNQGIGDGSNVSVNNAPTINELGDKNSAIKTITLKEGDAFVAHSKPVHIDTARGQVRIAPHTAVYVVSEGKSVAIYNIADKKASDVMIITSGKRAIPVRAGEQVVLAGKENKEFEKANPVPEIHAARAKELGEDMENRIFNAECSPIAVLDHAAGFRDLVNSKNSEDRKLADQILKMAAIVLSLRSADSN